MNIDQIGYFLDLVVTRSINQSAARLYLTSQGVSKSLAQLEKEIGFALFVRTSKGLELTEEGTRFARYAEEFWGSYCDFEEKVSHMGRCLDPDGGEAFNIVAAPLFSVSTIMARALADLRELNGDMTFDIVEVGAFDMGAYAQALPEEQITRTVFLSSVPDYRPDLLAWDERFKVVELGVFPMKACVSALNPLARRKSISCEDLAREMLTCYNEPVLQDVLHHMLDAYGEPRIASRTSGVNQAAYLPEAVFITAGLSPNLPGEGVVAMPIRDAVNIHLVAIACDTEETARVIDAFVRAIR
ncbi:MAG: LysR family transcriptional regulator [Eggerthellaceae bacterium]|nr:LysR family transcriptional regulator [Eggerthellaceae bacterium]